MGNGVARRRRVLRSRPPIGDYIYLDGGWGDDTLAASGGYNYVVGQGGVDTCFNGGEGGCTCEIKDCGDEDEPSAAVAP